MCAVAGALAVLVGVAVHRVLGLPVWLVASLIWVPWTAKMAFSMRWLFGGGQAGGGPGAAGVREPREPRDPLLGLGATAEPGEDR